MYTFVKTIADADDVILASPVYHRSYSETLKNAFDNLDCDAFLDKAVGLLSHGSTAKNALLSCKYLVPVVHTLYRQALQYQVASAKDDFVSENAGRTWRLNSEDVRARCAHLVDEMYKF
ncbi:NADPH-dependent FMN reductase [Bartonella sp. AA23NXGY]|uniref:NADPH-dependent FMN reductase n=1 Tax=Bartonella sp. AA23NXGY TaxID=3243431 RepID=UPI0035D0D1A4